MDDFTIEWCTFCSKAPSDGIVTVEDPDNGLMDLPACIKCYNGLLKNQ